MNEKTSKQFFELIRSGLWGTEADSSLFGSDTDWNTLYRNAVMQSLLGIFTDGVNSLQREKLPPADISRRLLSASESIRRENLKLDSILAELVMHLRHEGIEGIVLKGQGLARDYLRPEHRMCGDIDFYPGKDFGRSCELVRGMDVKEGDEHESKKHFCIHIKGCTIEIHRFVATSLNPREDRKLKKWAATRIDSDPKLRHIEISGTEINLPPVAFDSVFILQHIAGHFVTGGIGLRQLCDWCRFLHVHGKEINTSLLEEDLHYLGLMNIWRLMGWIAVNYLGLPEEEMPFYSPSCGRRAERCLKIILRRGNFGKYDKSGGRKTDLHYILRKIRSCIIMTIQGMEMMSVVPRESSVFFFWYLLDGMRRLFRK